MKESDGENIESSNKGLIIGGIIALLALVGIIAISQSDLAPIQENQAESAIEGEEDILTDGRYQAILSDSEVEWEGAKTVIVDWSHAGQISLESGNLEVENGELVGGEFVIDMNSISVTSDGASARSDNVGLISHLKSEDFFAVETYPTATFVITEVTKTGVNSYEVIGDMTIKGTTESLTVPVTTRTEGTTIVATADMVIDRTLFDVRFGSGKFFDGLGDNAINDEFTLKINVEAELVE